MMRGERIGILGAGLIGCYVAGQLAAAGRNVVMIGRGRIQGELAHHGLTLTHYDRPTLEPTGFLFSTDMAALKGCAIILVCVKSQDSVDAAREIEPFLRDDAIIISFQNGISNAERLSAVLPGRTILRGVVPFNVTSPKPGTFHCGTEGALLVEAHPHPELAALKTSFEAVGQGLELRDDIENVLWGKLLLNLNNSLNTLSGGPLREGLVQTSYRRVLATLIDEALGALSAAGIEPAQASRIAPEKLPKLLRLPGPIYRFLMDRLLKIDPKARSSMLDDLELGRPSENAFIQDEVIQLGRQHGAPVDTNRRVAEAVEHAFANGASPNLSGAEMVRRFLD